MERVERESKKARNTGGFSGAPSGGKRGFQQGQSRPTQLESVVQSSKSGYLVAQGQHQMQRKSNSSFQSRKHLRCSNCCRFHYGRCFGSDRACFTCGEKGHIAKYFPKGNPRTSQAMTHLQGTATGTLTQTQPARTAQQGVRGCVRNGWTTEIPCYGQTRF